MLTMSVSLAPNQQICTECDRPTRIGPMMVAPASSFSILVEIEAAWNAGMISTFAVSVRRQNG